MDNLQYQLNGIYRAFSVTGNETLSLSVYQGSSSLVVFKKGTETRRPVVKMTLSAPACIKITDILKRLMDAQPETREPFLQQTFNKETRAYETTTTFVFFKDDHRRYGVEVSSRAIPTPIKFVFKCPSTFSTGNEALTDEQKSLMAVRELIQIFELQLPMATLLSRFNMDPLDKRGNRGGNAPMRRDGQRGGQQRDSFSSDGSEENVFG